MHASRRHAAGFFFVMATNPYDVIIRDSVNTAAAGSDASPTGIEFLDNLLYPNLQQQKEFGQQVALQQMQNDWSVGGKMQAMKEAGINPNTAAAGIAGSSTPSAASPNSSVGAGAAGVGAAAQGLGSVAQTAKATTDAIDRLSTLSSRKQQIKADTVSLLEKAGLDKWSAKSIAEMLPYNKSNSMADFYLKLGNLDKVVEERKNLIQKRDNMKKEIDQMDAQITLFEKQGNLVDAEKLRVDQQTKQLEYDNWWSETDKQFWLDHGYRQDDDMDKALRNAISNGKSMSVNDIGVAIEQYNYLATIGEMIAKVDTAFDLEWNKTIADYSVKAEYAPYLSQLEVQKQGLIDLIKFTLTSPDDIDGIVGKAITWLTSYGLSFDLTKGVVNNASKPHPSPKTKRSMSTAK